MTSSSFGSYTVKAALLNCTLRLISERKIDFQKVHNASDLLNDLRNYRAQLSANDPLKQVLLPDEI